MKHFKFLILARIQFPKNEPISSIVRKRYSREVLKTTRKFERIDYKLRRAKFDISFLIKYQNESIIPDFLKFRLANKNLRNSNNYRKCQQSVLQIEINNKKSHLKSLQNEFNRVGSDLQFRLSCIGFAHLLIYILLLFKSLT